MIDEHNDNRNSGNGDELFDEEALREAEKYFKEAAEELEKELGDDYSSPADLIAEKIESGSSAQEAVRDVVFDTLGDVFLDEDLDRDEIDALVEDGCETVKEKKKELYRILEELDSESPTKSIKDVAAVFSSLLEIQSQLCLQKTEGVITVRSRLFNFFNPKTCSTGTQQLLRQEIALIFTPEEVRAIRVKLSKLEENDPMQAFFTMIVDQAYDIVQHNEMTGHLLLEMANYFIRKLEIGGYNRTPKVLEFRERQDRSKISLEKAIDELRDLEVVINRHLRDRPILLELPKLIRALIQIKLGLLNPKLAPKIVDQIRGKIGDYSRARSIVAFDFNRLPSFQHGLHLRQSIVLNLQKDVVKYSKEVFNQEFAAIRDDFERFLQQIEDVAQTLDPQSPQFIELMKRKAQIQKKLENHRRKLRVLDNQQSLIDIQHSLVSEAIQRYNKNEALQKKVEEQLQSQIFIDPEKVRQVDMSEKKRSSRMVMAPRRNRDES
ncbi:MAG: hypothetical protein AB1656_13375 [Candidatus Omnitrophota bacterium]